MDFQFLGFFGIFKRALSITISRKRIYGQLTLSIIIRFFFTFSLAHTIISDNKQALVRAQILFQSLSLISASAVVYTTACICAAKEVTYENVMQVVPKVWNRLLITYVWNFIFVLAFNIFALFVLVLWNVSLGPSSIGIFIGANLLVFYLLGFVYFGILWQLASVVSVLEDVHGIQAMSKSRELIKGRTGVCAAIFLVLNLCFVGIQVSVVGEGSRWGGIWYAWLRLVLLSVLILCGLIIQTVVYLSCKFYLHENIDDSSLSDHLLVSGADDVPFEAQDCSLFLLAFLFFSYFGNRHNCGKICSIFSLNSCHCEL